MSLAEAIEVTEQLNQALKAELKRADEQRAALRSFDGARLLDMAAQRERFNDLTQGLRQSLAKALTHAGQQHQLSAVTLEALCQVAPAEGRQLSDRLTELRQLAGQLTEADSLNRTLADRGLNCVRAYTHQVQPAPTAYDRRGARATPSTPTWSKRI